MLKPQVLRSPALQVFWEQVPLAVGVSQVRMEEELLNVCRKSGALCSALFASQPSDLLENGGTSWARLDELGCPYVPLDTVAEAFARWQPRISDPALAAIRQEVSEQGGIVDVPATAVPDAAPPVVESPRQPRPIATAYATIYKAYLKQALGPAGDADYVPLAPSRLPATHDVKLIAYYLPQYHPIPENDEWWGKGFTDWSNVAKAVPSFVGHYQPRLPGELGFYDLRVPDVMKRQAELARRHGVSTFCFYAYWFGGRRLLEDPVLAFLADPTIDIEFFLCWANENWSRRWDGAADHLLIGQTHSPQDDLAFIRYYRKYLDDPRHLRIDGKPVIMIYRPTSLPDPAATIECWREEAHRSGLPGLYVLATTAFGFTAAASLGFDAIVEFPPHAPQRPEMRSVVEIVNTAAEPTVFSYEAAARHSLFDMSMTSERVWPGVMLGWDNTARRASRPATLPRRHACPVPALARNDRSFGPAPIRAGSVSWRSTPGTNGRKGPTSNPTGAMATRISTPAPGLSSVLPIPARRTGARRLSRPNEN